MPDGKLRWFLAKYSGVTHPISSRPLTEAEKPQSLDPNNLQSPTEDRDRRRILSFSDGLLVALASAYGYLLSYQYEKGFADYFGIPDQFIEVSLANVLLLAGLALSFFVLYLAVINSFIVFIPPGIGNTPVVKRNVITLAIQSLFVYIPAYIYNTRFMWIFAISVSFFGVLSYFVFPLVWFRNEKGYLNKLEANEALINRDTYTSLIGWAIPKINRWNIILGIFLVYFVWVAHEAGRVKAAQQTDFLTTISSNQETALLRAYSDKLIFAKFNRNTKEVQRSFIILPSQELKAPLSLDEIGPLKPIRAPQAENQQVVPLTTNPQN